jgi:polysaccharide biosynthesis transport protein
MSLLTVLLILRRRIWILGVTFLATLAGAAALLMIVPTRYDAVATATIDPSISDPVSGQTTGVQILGIVQGNLIALAKSTQVALAVVKRLNADENPAAQEQYRRSGQEGLVDIQHYLANEFLSHVEARFGQGANVLSVVYKGNNPQQAATLANAFMSVVIDTAVSLKGAAAQKASDWYAPQIEKMRADLLSAREKLDRFQAETKLLAPSNSADSEGEQLAAVTSDLSKAKAELVALESQLTAPPPTAAASNDAQSVDLATLTTLRNNLLTIDDDLARLQTQVGPNNPRIIEKMAARQSTLRQIDAQIADYRKKLRDRIETQKGKVATLEAAYNARVNNMIGVQAQRERLAMLTRDVAFYQEELDRVLKGASIARLQSQLSFSNIAPLDVATPPISPAFPKPFLIFALATAAGLSLGILFALIAEALDRRLRTSEELPHVTGAHLLGAMVDFRPKAPTRLNNFVRTLRLGNRKKPAEAHS